MSLKKYKFTITGELLIPGDSSTMLIKPANIKMVTRISNYLDKNMPMTLLHVSLDKNLLDKLLMNAKTATIHLIISKFDADSTLETPVTETYIDDEFSIIVSNDINYNKEVDYPEDDSLSSTPERKDVYREVNIGLISKSAIDANKVVSNGIIHNSSMMDLACSYMTKLHLLIEPFNYNGENTQLSVPPMDTLVQLVEYLNSVKVFYSTKYLFFIDEPYCTYLISRSGKGIKKKDDKYLDIQFMLFKNTEASGLAQGVQIDDENKKYVIPIPGIQSKYTIDHDAAKLVNNFETIVNPNVDSSIFNSQDMKSAENYVNKIVGTFRAAIHNYIKGIDGIAGALTKEVNNVQSYVDEINYLGKTVQKSFMDSTTSHFGNLKTNVDIEVGDDTITVDLISGGIKSMVNSAFSSAFSSITSGISSAYKLNSGYASVSSSLSKNNYDIHLLDNYLASVTFVNAQDVINKTTSMINKTGASINGTVSSLSSSVTSQLSSISNIVSTVSSITNTLGTIVDTIQTIESNPYYSYVASQHADQKELIDKIKINNDKMKGVNSEINTQCSYINNMVSTLTSQVNFTAKMMSSIQSSFPSFLNEISKLNIKKKFDCVSVDTRSLSTVNSAIQSLTNLFKTLTSSGSISFEDIEKITKNLNNVTDIGNIGKLGLTNFSAKVNFGGSSKDPVATMVLKTKNDNPNMIKNVKSEMESMINQLTVEKVHLDPSIFTPNKRYTVRNYDAHSDKDGIFILNKKTEIYIREDDKFYCKTILDFSKILEDADNKSESKNSTSTTQTAIEARNKDLKK